MPKAPAKSTATPKKKPVKKPVAKAKAAVKPRKVSAKAKVEGVPRARASIVSPTDRQRMIQDAAYHLAEKDGFQHGREQQYWLTAEAQIDQLIASQTVVATGNQQSDAVDLTNDIH